MGPLRAICVFVGAAILLNGIPLHAQEPHPIFMAVGDSLGEGVQSGDASSPTQLYSFANILAFKLGVPFPLPSIQSGPFGTAGDTSNRSRINPALLSNNLAVSGATVGSALRERADGIIDTETDLVLQPRQGSQVEIAESLRPTLVACLIGNNDALGAVLEFDHLDASQLTPVAEFASDFQEIVRRLRRAGSVPILGTIPNVTDIAYVLDRQDLIRFLGSDYGLPAGSYTTVPTMMLVKLGLENGSVFQDPNYLLDPNEITAIRNRISAFNQIIRDTAAAENLPLAEINAMFAALTAARPTIFGVQLTSRYLGGLFSLDGVHPSNFGHALLATAFISAINAKYGQVVPQLTAAEASFLFMTDPFIDKDSDGRVAGRAGAGFIETIGPLLGISGDSNDSAPSVFSDSRRSAETAGALLDAKPAIMESLRKAFGSRPH
jgi:lysophospholipase L1-like esterase